MQVITDPAIEATTGWGAELPLLRGNNSPENFPDKGKSNRDDQKRPYR